MTEMFGGVSPVFYGIDELPDWFTFSVPSRDRHGWACRAKGEPDLANCDCGVRDEYIEKASRSLHGTLKVFA